MNRIYTDKTKKNRQKDIHQKGFHNSSLFYVFYPRLSAFICG